MGVSDIYKCYGVYVDTDAILAATLVCGITRWSLGLNSELRTESTSGEPYGRFVSMVSQNPVISFDTLAIKQALDIVDDDGSEIGGTDPGVSFFLRKAGASGSVNRKLHVSEGLLVPRTLSVSHQGDATLSIDTMIQYDDDTPADPIVLTESSALSGSVTDAERFTMGVCKVGAVTLTQMKSIDIDWGLDVRQEVADGDLWPTKTWVADQKPTITIRGINTEWLKDSGGFPLEGTSCTQANTLIVLKKRAAGGTFVADVTQEHISIAAAGMVTVDTMDAMNTNAAECTLRIQVIYDGSNSIFTIDTTAANSLS